MTELTEKFFQAYRTQGMKCVYTHKVPREMMQSGIDRNGWYEWKLVKGTLSVDEYRKIETEFNVILPDNFIEWHKQFFFADCDCSLVRLPCSLPTRPLEDLISTLDWEIPKRLIPLGLIPFAAEGNDSGPLVFDQRKAKNNIDFPIRVYDHDYGGDLEGLSEVIFSSFSKMLECLTHFLVATRKRKRFDVISDFYKIDPTGAGSTGKYYWQSWIEMEKANYEEFGY